MSVHRRAALLKLAAMAREMDLHVLTGRLNQDEQGQWRVGNQTVQDWLADYDQEEVVLVLGSLADDRPVETRTCRTCGRDYTDLECPHCRANRIRLRGR